MSPRAIAQPPAVRENDRGNATGILSDADAPPPRASNLAEITELDARFEEFLRHAGDYLNHSATTLKWYRQSFAAYRAYLVAGAGLDEGAFATRRHDVVGWISFLRRRVARGRQLTPIAVNTYWRGVRRFFVYLEAHAASVNPFRGMKPPKIQAPVPKAKSADDCRRILAAAYHYPWPAPDVAYKRALAHAVIAVMLLAGLRRSEVVHLMNADVDLATGTITITNGKGEAGGRTRRAYVSPDLKSILITFLRARDAYGEQFARGEFFVSPKSRRGLSLEGLRKIVAKVARSSGVSFTAHVLRHSFITHLLRSDVPLHIVKELAGHKDVATTLGYLRVFNQDLQTGIRKLRFA